MKKKILLTIALISMFIFAFVIAVSAETPAQYIEFGAKFPGSDKYITVYTEHGGKAADGNPKIDFANKKFYITFYLSSFITQIKCYINET